MMRPLYAIAKSISTPDLPGLLGGGEEIARMIRDPIVGRVGRRGALAGLVGGRVAGWTVAPRQQPSGARGQDEQDDGEREGDRDWTSSCPRWPAPRLAAGGSGCGRRLSEVARGVTGT